MLQLTIWESPGLSAPLDALPLRASDLGTPRYRRWVDRLRHARSATRRRERPAQPGRREPVRIRVPSPASGTLSRLP